MIRVDTTAETDHVSGPPTNLLQYPTKSNVRVNRLQTRHEGSSPASKAVQSSRLLDFLFGPVQQQKVKLKSNVGPRMNAMDTMRDRSLSPNSRSRRGFQGATQSLDRRGLVRQQTYAGHEGQPRPPMTDVDRRRENNSAPITQSQYQAPTSVFATQPRGGVGLKKAHTMEVSQFGKIKQSAAAAPAERSGQAPKVYKRAGGDSKQSAVETDTNSLHDSLVARPKSRPPSAPSDRRRDDDKTGLKEERRRSSRGRRLEEEKTPVRRKASEGSDASVSTTASSQSSESAAKKALDPPKYHLVSSQNASWMDGIVDDDVTLDCLTPVSCILAQSYSSDMSPRSSFGSDYSSQMSFGRETDDYEEVLRKVQQEAVAPPPTTKNVLVEFEF
ncbi:hypothetical protein ACHHYP_11726 [Achlya hypogyna]|uniref:Uncharacterized protein n=1 Tax=Achlya hypogyna TaxID=1202772 RepID=A0A1V9YIG1_ACHHY|nr:hypothetical protein ACHHYP_11726 [Achlya hypogyna]